MKIAEEWQADIVRAEWLEAACLIERVAKFAYPDMGDHGARVARLRDEGGSFIRDLEEKCAAHAAKMEAALRARDARRMKEAA